MIYNPAHGDFSVRKGPIFSNFILADEINRAPAKGPKCAIKPCKKSKTIGKREFSIRRTISSASATQNPIEQEGTYPHQRHKWIDLYWKVLIDYPSKDEERYH